MESNGQKGKIQVSQVTADLLVAAGKDKWLTAREDKVQAKGKGKNSIVRTSKEIERFNSPFVRGIFRLLKGEMQCYWVDVALDPSMRSSIASSKSQGSGDNLPKVTYENQMEV